MKPSFALNLSHEGIGLLHRTIRGWLLVGEVALDVPDLAEAMGYLRSTALGLEPRGVTTKLILPSSQILYTTIDAPGPTASKRRAQIRAGLEGLTPYAVDDLVYDWAGTGNMVQVAVVARETLDEAESFAAEHRFGPVSFVAIPEPGEFASEPFFGATKASIDLLGGDKVERDQDPVRIVGSAVLPRSEPVEAEETLAAPDQAEVTEAEIAPVPAPAPEPTPAEAEAAPVLEIPEASVDAETVATAPSGAAEHLAAPVAAPAPPPPEPAAPAPEPEPLLVIPADDALNDLPHKPIVLEELADLAPQEPSPARPTLETLTTSVTDPVIEDTPASAKTLDPFGGKVKGDGAKGAAPAEVGAPTFSSRRTLPGALDAFGVPKLGAALPATSVPPVTKAEEAPSPAKAGAPALGGVSSPTKPRPATMPDAVRTAIAAKATKPVALKGQKPAIPAKLKASGGETLTRFIPHKGKPGTATIEPTAPNTPVPASEQEAMTVFGARGDGVQRGKPRYLGLILTVILLALLAAVALWSTIFLSDNSTTSPPTTQTATVAPSKPAEQAAPTASTETSGQTLSATVASPAAPAPAEVAANGAQAWQPQAGLGTPKVDGSNGMALASVDPKVAVPASAPRPEATTLVSDVAPEPAQTPPSLADIAAAKAAVAAAAVTAAQPDTAVAALTPPAAPLGAITAPEVAPTAPQADAAPLDPPPEADPALSHVKPKPRPAAIGGPITSAPPASPDQTAQAAVADTNTSAMAPTQTILPKGRPASLDAAPVVVAQTPAPTPPGILVEPTSRLAIASSIIPKTRPAKFAAVAVAAAPAPVAAPQPQSDSTTPINQALAAAVSTPEPKVTQASTAMVAAADGEPEPPTDAPRTPVNASVAKEATVASAINVNRVNLLGVYGTNSDRSALVRLPGGRILKVQVGDALDGGRVAAIGADNLYYVKNGQNLQLTMPRG